MSTRIEKLFETETAHIVRNAVSEKCALNIHGHSYLWRVTIEGPVDEITGMVLDFIELKPIKDFIDKFDHAMILWDGDPDEIFKMFFHKNCKRVIEMKKNCTAENMARIVFKFTQDWLDKKWENWLKEHFDCQINSPYNCVEVRVNETRTGCGITTCSDNNDICTYIHEN